MTEYLVLKFLHVLGAIVILGTGTGIAFFMLMAHRSGDVAFIARTAATVVVADVIFTATAVILQPITGGLLMMLTSAGMTEPWIVISLALFLVAGLFWIPVVSSRSRCAIWRRLPMRRAPTCRPAISSF